MKYVLFLYNWLNMDFYNIIIIIVYILNFWFLTYNCIVQISIEYIKQYAFTTTSESYSFIYLHSLFGLKYWYLFINNNDISNYKLNVTLKSEWLYNNIIWVLKNTTMCVFCVLFIAWKYDVVVLNFCLLEIRNENAVFDVIRCFIIFECWRAVSTQCFISAENYILEYFDFWTQGSIL